MKPNRKTILLLLLNVSFIFSFRQSFAQYPGMRAVYSNMNRQLMTQQMVVNNQKFYDNTDDYVVTMKDSSHLLVSSKMYFDTVKRSFYLIYENFKYASTDSRHNQKIYPDETAYINHNIGPQNVESSENTTSKEPNTPVWLTGMAMDSCWMFKVLPGAINIYSITPESSNFDQTKIVGIQSENGLIENYNTKNLKKIILSDVEAMKYFEKKKYYKAITTYNKDMEKGKILNKNIPVHN